MRTPWITAALAACLLCAAACPGHGQAKLPMAPPSAPAGAPNAVVDLDRDSDGKLDYRVIYDSRGRPSEEDLDFNYDGVYDTFYYYAAGVLQRVDIDSRSAGKVDIRVWLLDGTYIKRYERDMDGDGKPDVVKDYTGGA
jgi:hypothetical protein